MHESSTPELEAMPPRARRVWLARVWTAALVLGGLVWTAKLAAALIVIGVSLATIDESPRWIVITAGMFIVGCGIAWFAVLRPKPVRARAPALDPPHEVRHARGGLEIVASFDPDVRRARRGKARFVVGIALLLGLTERQLRELLERAQRVSSRTRRADDYLAGLARTYSLRARSRLDRPMYFWRPPLRVLARWLARAFERAADSLDEARRTADDEPARESLEALRRLAAYLDTVHWPAVWARVDLDPEPPQNVFSDLAASLPQALGLPAPTAGEALLGVPAMHEVAAEFDRTWIAEVADEWREHYQNGLPALAQLEAAAGEGLLTPPDIYRYATLVERFRGHDEARPLYEQVLEAAPYWPPPNLSLGRLLLEQGNEAGLMLIERAINEDQRVLVHGCNLAVDYLERLGRTNEAAVYRRRASEQLKRDEEASVEREFVHVDDEHVPHGLSEADLLPLIEVLKDHGEVDAAHLVRKRVDHYADASPVHLLGVLRRSRWWRLEPPDYDHKLATALRSEVTLPGWTGVIVTTSVAELKRWFARHPRSEIYVRRKRLRRRRLALAALMLLVLVYLLSRADSAPSAVETPADASVAFARAGINSV